MSGAQEEKGCCCKNPSSSSVNSRLTILRCLPSSGPGTMLAYALCAAAKICWSWTASSSSIAQSLIARNGCVPKCARADASATCSIGEPEVAATVWAVLAGVDCGANFAGGWSARRTTWRTAHQIHDCSIQWERNRGRIEIESAFIRAFLIAPKPAFDALLFHHIKSDETLLRKQ